MRYPITAEIHKSVSLKAAAEKKKRKSSRLEFAQTEINAAEKLLCHNRKQE